MFSKLNCIIVFLFYALNLTYSQAPDPSQLKSYVIAGVNVEGNVYADASTIIAISGLISGEKINYPYDDKVINSIKNLWDRKQFANVDVIVARITSEGIFLTIKVKELPRISEIILVGNYEIKDKEILKAIGKSKGDIFSNYDVYVAKREIKKLYDNDGYSFAQVQTEVIKTDSATHSKLKITINEGSEYKVESITFEGNEKLSSSELAGTFDDTKTKSWYQFWRSSKFDKKKYIKDKQLLTAFFKKKGFIDAQIVKDTILFDPETEKVQIQLKVTEGLQYFVRNIKFVGNTVFSEEMLLARLEFEKGDYYDVERFQKNLLGNEALNDAASLYHNSGYLAARFEKEELKIGTDSIDIKISVIESDRFKIRRVELVGNTKTKDKVIRRELFTRPGDYFDRSSIIRSVRALSVMNYFNPEKLQPQPMPVPGDATSVDIIYKVEEKSTDTFNASIGFAGTFGLTGSVGFTFNNFSLYEPLSGGAGQLFNFNWEFGQASRFQQFSLGYTEPWLNDSPTTLGFNVFDSRLRFSYDLRRTGVSMNIGRRLRWPDDYFRIDGTTRFQLNNVGSTSSYGFFRPGLTSEFNTGFSISRISLDSPFFPTSGSRFSINESFAWGALGVGNTDFLKSEFNFEFYNPLAKVKEQDRLVLMLSGKFGYLTGLNNDTTISPIELYRMGGNGLSGIGVTPLRGYADQAVESNGGKVLARFISELRFAISLDPMPIYVYAFAEAGNVWNNLAKADPFDLKRSAGVGLMMLLNPIGVIGFSYGYAFDPVQGQSVNNGWKFLFNLGQQ